MEQSATISGRYDLILMKHVLEHFIDPVAELKRMAVNINIDGQIYIEVPGVLSKIPSIQNAHNHYFSEITLESVVRQAGYSIVKRGIVDRFRDIQMLVSYTGKCEPPIKRHSEYRRVAAVVRRGRLGMLKGALYEKLGRTKSNKM